MNIIKKNIVSIVCGLVAILSVLVAVFVGQGLFDDLQTQMNKSKVLHGQMEQLLKTTRYMPGVDPYTAERIALRGFPSQGLIDDAKAATEQVKQQSLKMVDVATGVNRRTPLVPGSLPRAISQSEAIAFRDRYRALLMGNPPTTPPQLRQLMNATSPVTPDELKLEAERRWKIESEGLTRVGGQIVAEAEQRARADFEQKIQNLPIEMQAQRAASHAVYVSPGETTFDVYAGISQAVQSGAVPSPTDIWFAQLGLWIQQDVADAVAKTNAQSRDKGIPNAIVKHLARVRVPSYYITANGPVGVGSAGGGMGATPTPPSPAGYGEEEGGAAGTADTGDMSRAYAVSPSGRVCNSGYDVVHCDVMVRAVATRYGLFLAELSRGRLITILDVQMRAVDLRQAQAAGYSFGDGPVVTMVLKCEALFFRKWTEPLMPLEVKRMLGIGQQAAAATDTPQW